MAPALPGDVPRGSNPFRDEGEARERAFGAGGAVWGRGNGSVTPYRARVYVATTEGPALIQRLVAEDALAEDEPSAVCLNGTTTRLPITGAYTYFVRDHVRGFAGRTAFRLDLDRRIDGGSSWMLGVWIAHVLLAKGRLAMRGEGDGRCRVRDRRGRVRDGGGAAHGSARGRPRRGEDRPARRARGGRGGGGGPPAAAARAPCEPARGAGRPRPASRGAACEGRVPSGRRHRRGAYSVHDGSRGGRSCRRLDGGRQPTARHRECGRARCAPSRRAKPGAWPVSGRHRPRPSGGGEARSSRR